MSFETATEELKLRKKQVKSVKQVNQAIARAEKTTAKDGGEKEVHERYGKKAITLKIKFGEVSFDLTVFTSNRRGTLRRMICEKLGLKSGTKLDFLVNGVCILPTKDTPGTFLYTWELADGDVITASIAETEEPDISDDDDEMFMALPPPSSSAARGLFQEPDEEEEDDDEPETL
eukprot:Skav217062  [mRNA]  locus=scaffold208:287075:287599:- [translate_table: standard]